ncbi:MAG: RES family NAD+ phosphorylase [Synechococcaceae cyanobacterium]
MVAIELPDDLSTEVIEPATLPQDWHSPPAPTSLQTIGSTWLKRTRTAALIVPSAVIRVEANILLSPRHPEAQKIRQIRDEDLSFDPRLL